jgi:long-chain acyl-CoA synthetase
MGEKVGAAIVLKPGARAEAGDILQFAKEHLADFKVPQYLVLRSDTLPRNPGGKILKKQLRETLEWGKQLWWGDWFFALAALILPAAS